jgi:hypothetical protein
MGTGQTALSVEVEEEEVIEFTRPNDDTTVRMGIESRLT